jgi:hypothetical protein
MRAILANMFSETASTVAAVTLVLPIYFFSNTLHPHG